MSKKNPKNEDLIALFGDNVRRYRLLKGLTMDQLADKCEVQLGTISTIERGVVNCTISTAYSISKALDVTIDVLATEVPPKPKS